MTAALEQTLIDANKSRTLVEYRPELGPDSLDRSYEIQAAVAKALGATVVGWKCGVQDGGKTVFGAPIFEANLRKGSGTWQIPKGQAVKIEVEIALRLAKDLPPRAKPYAREEILDAVGEVFAGIEIVASRFSNLPSVPFEARVADNFNQGGYVTGGGTSAFRALDLSALRSKLWIDGALVHDKVGGHGQHDPLVPVVAWASRQCDKLGGLRAGQIITTGTLNKPPSLDHAAHVEIEIEGLGRAAVDFTA